MYSASALIAARRLECLLDGLYFFRFFFKVRNAVKALVNWHHHEIDKALQRVIDGEIKRLIITLPPGYTKTEMAVISFIARGLAINPRAKFMHLSYSDNLALLNSSIARSIVKCREYQEMWPLTLRDDTDSKALWWTEQGGGVYATSLQGQVTGFRAGLMESGFTGALIIDDGLKPDDALTVERGKTNDRYNNTVQSRTADRNTPIIVIMQRVHHDDLAGYLLKGGSGEKWHHLELPVDFPAEPYPAEWTHGIPIEYEPQGSVLWEAKHNQADIEVLKAKPRLYRTQYKQRPKKGGETGTLWKDDVIEAAKSLRLRGEVKRTVVAIDPSVTNHKKGESSGKQSDECGLVVASRIDCGNVVGHDDQYVVHKDYSEIMSPKEWAEAAIRAYEVHDADCIVVETNQGGDLIEESLRNYKFKGRIIKVHAKKGKYLRAEPVAPFWVRGLVRHEPGLEKLEAEMLDFVIGMEKSPNRVDALVYALTELSKPTGSVGW